MLLFKILQGGELYLSSPLLATIYNLLHLQIAIIYRKSLIHRTALATLATWESSFYRSFQLITLTTALIAAAFFLIGAGVGHLYSRNTGGSDGDKLRDLQQKLDQSDQHLKRYQQEVTEHFVKVSHLTTNMAQSYRQIHEHLASSAIRLAGPEVGRQLLKSAGNELLLTDENGNPLVNAEDLEPPRDYAPKAPGGVLSEDYGLNDDLAKEHPEGAANCETDEPEEDDPTLVVG